MGVRVIAVILVSLIAFDRFISAEGQPPIKILSSTIISADTPTATHFETWLAVNPRDAKNLIATSIVIDKNMGSVVYASFDSGKTWIHATHGLRAEKYFENIDPMVTF